MKKITLIFLAVIVIITVGCEGNTTGQYRHKPDHVEKRKLTGFLAVIPAHHRQTDLVELP